MEKIVWPGGYRDFFLYRSGGHVLALCFRAGTRRRHDWEAGIADIDCVVLHYTGAVGAEFHGCFGGDQYQRHPDQGGEPGGYAAGMSGFRCEEGADSPDVLCGFCDGAAGANECFPPDSISERGGCGV